LGWFVLGLAGFSLLAGSALSGWAGNTFLGALFVFLLALVVLLPLLALTRLASRRGTLAHRLKDPEGRALGLAATAVGISILFPWVGALAHGGDRLVGILGAIVVAATIVYAARQVTPGWAVLASIALVGSCLVAAVLSHAGAERLGWQDLHWRETTDDPMNGSSVDIAWGILGAVIFAPVAGTVLGIASQVNKREQVGAPTR
jgi:hypothetical protein